MRSRVVVLHSVEHACPREPRASAPGAEIIMFPTTPEMQWNAGMNAVAQSLQDSGRHLDEARQHLAELEWLVERDQRRTGLFAARLRVGAAR